MSADAGQVWTDERVEVLKRLWADGLSASQIANQIGGISRNAVIGKVHRLGLAGRAKAPGEAAETVEPVAAPPPAPRRAVKPTRPDGRPDEATNGSGAPLGAPRGPTPIAGAAAGLLAAVGGSRPAGSALAASQRVTIMDLREFMCRWPLGDPTSTEFGFCGGRAITGLPYCTTHARIAYQPAADRKRDRRIGGLR